MKQFFCVLALLGLFAAGCASTDSDAADGLTGSDDDDAAEITGNPDLDLDDLPDDVAEALDDIDDIVSIGDCSSDLVGLAVSAPEGWECRVLDQPLGDMDGFTLFTSGNELNITFGTPSPVGAPCELFQMCDDTQAIALSDNFPDTTLLSIAGTITIWGTHKNLEAEVLITNTTALTDAQIELVSSVLDSAVEL